MKKKVFISGMHSGQNPCSGVGIARCLRKAFPDLHLVGVDHWQGSSGLHDESVDEVLLLPQWKQIDDDRHVAQIRALLDEGHLWLSAMDMEVYWLSEKLGPHKNLLAPGGPALELTAKPAVKALIGLGFKVPEYIQANLSDSDVHTFLRHSSWQCWLKSPYHDAKRVSSWGAFERSRDSMRKSWKTSNLFLQKHVVGHEETVAFTAYQGELLAAVHLEKYQVTPEGKTWAGRVTPVDPEMFEHFQEAVKRMEWSGGGELEFVRDPDGQKWIIECNPRFPAWIYASALAGMNVPAKLISKVWDLPLLESVAKYPFFTRVVQEIPAKESVGLPLPIDATSLVWTADGKKGKGGPPPSAFLPDLKDSNETTEENENVAPLQLPENVPLPFLLETEQIARTFQGETPTRIHLEDWTHSRFESLAQKVKACHSKSPEVRIGYSVKTSPTDDHLRKAMKFGFFAECISQMEVRRAITYGFRPDQVILNGPGKFWPLTSPPTMGLHMLFCDSVEEFDRILEVPGMTKCLGFRMRLPKLHSRFGNSLSEFENFQRITTSVRKMKNGPALGFHFHMPSWAIGMQRWNEGLESLFIWCQTIEQLTGVPVKRLDMGGGFFPADLQRLDLSKIQAAISEVLPQVQAIYFEPGRSLTQDGEVLVSRILDVRRTPEGDLHEVVVDACVAELPLAQSYSHRIFFQPKSGSEPGAAPTGAGDFKPLEKGPTRILGRICMEDDILSNGLDLPKTAVVGDFIIFGDAGGYERSMSYVFGRG